MTTVPFDVTTVNRISVCEYLTSHNDDHKMRKPFDHRCPSKVENRDDDIFEQYRPTVPLTSFSFFFGRGEEWGRLLSMCDNIEVVVDEQSTGFPFELSDSQQR